MKLIKINLIVIILLLISFSFVQTITAGVLFIDQTLTTGNIQDKCVSYFPVRLDSEGANTNSADIKISFDNSKAQIYDFDSTRSGAQVQNGSVFTNLPYNLADNVTGEIKVTGYRLNSFNGENIFFYVYFEALQYNTNIDFEIEFTAVDNTYDSNIAETSTSLDLLTSIENRSFIVQQDSCDKDLPIPEPEVDPGEPSEPETPVSPPITPVDPEYPQSPEFPEAESLIDNLEILAPLALLLLSLLIPGLITGNPLEYIIYFIASFLIKKKYWGIVFNIANIERLPFTTVRLYKIQNGEEVFIAQTITDLDGRYGFVVSEGGTYSVKFLRDKFAPTTRKIRIGDDGEIILDVGLVPLEKTNINLLTKIRGSILERSTQIFVLLRLLSIFIMSIGTYLTSIFFSNYPSTLSLIIFLVYWALLIIQICAFIFPLLRGNYARVEDIENKVGIKGAIVRLYSSSTNEVIGESPSITNDNGIIKIRVKKGSYKFSSTKPGFEIASGVISFNEKGGIEDVIYMKKIKDSVSESKFAQG